MQHKYTCEGAAATDWPVETTSGWTPCICEEETEKQMWWQLNKYENKRSTVVFIANMNWYVRLDDFINSIWNFHQVELLYTKGELFAGIIRVVFLINILQTFTSIFVMAAVELILFVQPVEVQLELPVVMSSPHDRKAPTLNQKQQSSNSGSMNYNGKDFL